MKRCGRDGRRLEDRERVLTPSRRTAMRRHDRSVRVGPNRAGPYTEIIAELEAKRVLCARRHIGP